MSNKDSLSSTKEIVMGKGIVCVPSGRLDVCRDSLSTTRETVMSNETV